MEQINLNRRTGNVSSRKPASKACEGFEFLEPIGWKFRCIHPVVMEELGAAGSLKPGEVVAKAFNKLFDGMELKLRGNWTKDHWPTMFNPEIVENCLFAPKSEMYNSNL